MWNVHQRCSTEFVCVLKVIWRFSHCWRRMLSSASTKPTALRTWVSFFLNEMKWCWTLFCICSAAAFRFVFAYILYNSCLNMSMLSAACVPTFGRTIFRRKRVGLFNVRIRHTHALQMTELINQKFCSQSVRQYGVNIRCETLRQRLNGACAYAWVLKSVSWKNILF